MDMTFRQQSSAERPGFVPRLETLEGRCVPAVVVGESNGVLTIQGDARRNTVAITDDGGTANGSVRVAWEGREFVSANPVNTIRLRSRGGRDQVSYTLTGPLQQRRLHLVDLDLGSGNDVLNVTLNAGVQARAFLDLRLDGDVGNDRITVNAVASVAVEAEGKLRWIITGGDQNDRITTDFVGTVQGELLTRSEGNPGQDQVFAEFFTQPGSTGTLGAAVFGGTSFDRLRLLIREQDPADPLQIVTEANGGQFLDILTRTANVRTVKVEVDRVVD
jgi:hypothetical protein